MEKIDYVEGQTKVWADFTLETMELLNKRNVIQAEWLDRIYMAAAATPLVAGVVALVTVAVIRFLG